MRMNQPKMLKSELKGFDVKKHYITRWFFEHKVATTAACGQYVRTFKSYNESTYHKNHVTCKNCRRTKEFRGIK